MNAPLGRAEPRSVWELFTTFTKLALQGFGGVMAVVQRVLCEEKRWLTREEFLGTLALAQALPGPNVCNISMMIGDRFFGTRGAIAALSGMLLVPGVCVLSLAALQGEFAALPAVQGALRGVAAVTAGLVVGTGMRLSSALRDSPLGLPATVGLGGATFVALAWLRFPMGWTLLVLGGASWAHALICLERTGRADAAVPLEAKQPSKPGSDSAPPREGVVSESGRAL